MSVHSGGTQGRVRSIKSKFENLNSFESLDISTTAAATTAALANNHLWKSAPKFLFKRSLTTIDFRSKCNSNHNNTNTINTGNGMNSKNDNKLLTRVTKTSTSPVLNPDEIKKSTYLRRHNNLDRTVSADTYSIRKRTNDNNNTSADDTLKPLKELKENVEIRLTRHTNDPIKRSSIKRSPAFRVGASDKCHNSFNGNASKTNEKTNTNTNNDNNTKTESIADKVPTVAKELKMPKEPKVPKEFANKINDVLKRCDNDKLNEPGLTDTLKAFLRQPLPDGPAPKKPPRAFQTNNNNNNPESTNEIKQKINLLENQLVFKQTKTTKATPSPTPQKTKSWRSAKDKSTNSTNSTGSTGPFGSSLLNCIVPCSSTAIYDTMIVDNKSPIKMLSTTIKEAKEQNSEQTLLLTNKSQPMPTQMRRLPNGIRISPAEHIYMEPFAHLKSNNNVINCNGTTTSLSSPTQTAPTTTTTTLTMHNNNQCRNHSGSPTLSNQTNDANGSVDGDSLGSSLVSCTSCTADDHSLTDLHDIHYMVSSGFLVHSFFIF